MDPDYTDAKTVESALAEWAEVFKKLPRIDAVFVPGGDPGHTRPGPLMALLEKQTANLKRFHPNAQMWVSPQSFSQVWLDEFVTILRTEPAWLGGVVYGPQVRVSLPELRKAVPARYPIRDYPDITHSLRCQYAVPDWDVAYSLTEAREVINPRPRDEATIFHAFADQTIGFITYSEGCNDDVNKIVWSALGWDPGADVLEILRQYSRYFIGARLRRRRRVCSGTARPRAKLARAAAHQQCRSIPPSSSSATWNSATPDVLQNWRFQQALYRAYYDAFVRSRLIYETDLEQQALARLRVARDDRFAAGNGTGRGDSRPSPFDPPATDLRARIFALAEALFQSIRMQLSVPLYKAIHFGRGATLDTIDVPLNNRNWLRVRFDAIRKLDTEESRQRGIEAIVNWTNPGPGGFYDDLGDPLRRPHLVMGSAYDKDPAFLHAPQTGFDWEHDWRRSWCRHAGASSTRRFECTTPASTPRRLTSCGSSTPAICFRPSCAWWPASRLEIHPYLLKPRDMKPLEFDLPPRRPAPARSI